ncbi:hypothetical protein [Armatimonas sp.]|uniref:hypothetical protein n=1 Tax=Armatimonas sp. TaxID=1872638 RepID=UPI00374FDC27
MSLPAVAVTKDGKRVLVAWKQASKDAPHISWREATGSARDADLQPTPGGTQDHPCLAFAPTPEGTWAAVWEETRAGRQSVWYRTSKPGDSGKQLSTESQAAFPVLVIGEKQTTVAYETKQGDRLSVIVQNL